MWSGILRHVSQLPALRGVRVSSPWTFGVSATASTVELRHSLTLPLLQPMKSALAKVLSHSQNQPGSYGLYTGKKAQLAFLGVESVWRGTYQISWCHYSYCFSFQLCPLPTRLHPSPHRCGSCLVHKLWLLQSFLPLFTRVPCSGKEPDGDLQFRCYLHTMSGHRSLHQLPSAARGRLSISDDDWIRHRSDYGRISLRIISLIFFFSACLLLP